VWEVPVYAETFDVDPIFSVEMTQSFDAKLYYMEEVVENVPLQCIEGDWAKRSYTDFVCFSIMYDLLEQR
jgi:hypothetical protein